MAPHSKVKKGDIWLKIIAENWCGKAILCAIDSLCSLVKYPFILFEFAVCELLVVATKGRRDIHDAPHDSQNGSK